MKHLLCILACLVLATAAPRAQDSARAVAYEYAIVKWEGQARLAYNLPDQFEFVDMRERKVPLPKGAQEEEFWLAYAANELAKQGWEAVNLNSRRILFRRPRK